MKYLTLLLIVIAFATPATIVVAFLYRLKRARSSVHLKLVGEWGTADENLDPAGAVLINGELWPARSSGGNTISAHQRVRVIDVDQGRLIVDPADV